MHIKPKLKKRTLLNLAMFAFRVNPPIFREWIKPTLMKFYTSVSYFIKNLPKSICVCIIYLYNIDAYKRRVLNGGCEEERWWRGGWYGSEFDTNTLHLTPLEYGWNFRFFLFKIMRNESDHMSFSVVLEWRWLYTYQTASVDCRRLERWAFWCSFRVMGGVWRLQENWSLVPIGISLWALVQAYPTDEPWTQANFSENDECEWCKNI